MEEAVNKPASKSSTPSRKPTAAKRPLAKTPAKNPSARKTVTPKKPAAPKPVKLKKPKLVRDSFSIPKDEYGMLAELKQRTIKLGHPSKKSELLRAGIQALVKMSDKAFLSAIKAIPSIKTGRPKKA